ncbi:MAG: LysR family transcriptional regulator substrate-binding protein, partial [Polyangiales bacterium]
WPRVDVRVRTGESREIARMVREREVDCGFVTSKVDVAGLALRPLYREEIVLVVAADSGWGTRVELADVPLIAFPERAGFRRFLERAFAAAGLSPQVKMEIDSVEATKGLVAAGLGGAFLPAPAVQHELGSQQLQRLRIQRLPRLHRQTYLVQREDQRPSAALRHFLTLLAAKSGSPEDHSR